MKTCIVCNVAFSAIRFDAKTCGPACRKRLQRSKPTHVEPQSSGWDAYFRRPKRDSLQRVTDGRRTVTQPAESRARGASQVAAGKVRR